ncbi:MAG: hypothetical protein M3680_19375 [Myxococcota bacterium]|nr:hypothetical protein [Myxococcota bacterium]
MTTFVFPLSLLMSVACSSDGEGGSTDRGDTADPRVFCRSAAIESCATMYSCLTEAERRARNLPATQAECQRSAESACEFEVERCTDRTHGYSSSAAATCLDQMADAQCNDAGEPWLDAPACDQVCARTAGAFYLAWDFESYYSCYDVRASTLSVIAIGAGQQFVTSFQCRDGRGITDYLPVGTYRVRVELHDAGGTRLWSTERPMGHIDADVVDLGTLVIPVSS